MRLHALFGGLAIAAMMCGSMASSASLNKFSSLIVLGDSLSDPGNLFAATNGAAPPSPPYFYGRFSNGPVWAEAVAQRFSKKGLGAYNFAYGGAQAVPDDDGIPDLDIQTGLATQIPRSALGSSPVVVNWIGANDGFTALKTGADVKSTAQRAAAAIGVSAKTLSQLSGVKNFVFLRLPDFGATPRFNGSDVTRQAGNAYSDWFNATLEGVSAQLQASGLNVWQLDPNLVTSDAIANPKKYGLTNVTDACLSDAVICDNPSGYVFFDQVHPTNVGHEAISGLVSTRVAPVPLPASLAFLIAAIGLLCVRRGGKA